MIAPTETLLYNESENVLKTTKSLRKFHNDSGCIRSRKFSNIESDPYILDSIGSSLISITDAMKKNRREMIKICLINVIHL